MLEGLTTDVNLLLTLQCVLEYLRRLVSHLGSAVAAIDLVTDGRGTVVQPHADTVIDRQAATAYRRRLAEIDDELAQAQEWSDLGRMERLSGERGALLDELSAASGLGGRARGTGSTQERARVAATKAMTSAIKRISLVDPELGRHLHDSVRTGTECSYRPSGEEEVGCVLAG